LVNNIFDDEVDDWGLVCIRAEFTRLVLVGKAAEHEADHSPPSSVEVKNMWK
jgi:hypothetical protein